MPTAQSPAAEAQVVADTVAPIPRTCPFVDIVPASLYYLGYNTTDVVGATGNFVVRWYRMGDGSVAEWLACWTQAQQGPGANRSRDAVG